ncbi:hypothetical protein BC936DRAFT_149203 [Jimgerdemannia flammicorona]|uniref:DUF1348-domain-containing protein n=1 Tax=Jimgerdemannia flammicorona TaxID=994334 RepID=A0A433D1B5_9FUNG|nr:hypothetical protein BC936DRAFT_149203 [Jimgerdemannia flammicorona]
MQATPLIPPFTQETAHAKVKRAQDMWNTRNPEMVAKGYTQDCLWRNRDSFFSGHDNIIKFLTDKWSKELGYRLRKELFSFTGNKIAVNFWYEFHDEQGQWCRGKVQSTFNVTSDIELSNLTIPLSSRTAYGLEHWTFNEEGIMSHRQMSANNIPIADEQRWFKDVENVNDAQIVDE